MDVDINKVIGLEGGQGAAWFHVLQEEGRGETSYYPAIVDGREASWTEFKSWKDFAAHQVERTRQTIRLVVAGNPVAAETAVSGILGCKCLACSPNTIDVYPDQPLMTPEQIAAELGRRTSERKATAARDNGRKGGRPRKQPESTE